MRRRGSTLAAVAVGLALAASVAPAAAHPGTRGKVGPSAVWPRSLQTLNRAQIADFQSCLTPPRSGWKTCVERFMRRARAPGEAIAFFAATRTWLVAFTSIGGMDVGYTVLPYPVSGGREKTVFLDASPPNLVAQVPDVSHLESYAPLARAYQGSYRMPVLAVDSQAPGAVESVRRLGGGREVVLQFPLLNGCQACAIPYSGRVGFRFSGTHRYVGVIELGPCLDRVTKGQAVKLRLARCPATVFRPPL